MKTVIAILMTFLTLNACQTSHPSQESASDQLPFAKYRSLADALRSYGGLYITAPVTVKRFYFAEIAAKWRKNPYSSSMDFH